jgi:hypothetical protein
MAAGEPALKLLGALAAETRRLIAARQLLDGELRGRWKRGMSYAQFQQHVVNSHEASGLARSAYGEYMCLLRAQQFSQPQLCQNLVAIHEADARLKSSVQTPHLTMERLVLRLCMADDPKGTLARR